MKKGDSFVGTAEWIGRDQFLRIFGLEKNKKEKVATNGEEERKMENSVQRKNWPWIFLFFFVYEWLWTSKIGKKVFISFSILRIIQTNQVRTFEGFLPKWLIIHSTTSYKMETKILLQILLFYLWPYNILINISILCFLLQFLLLYWVN